MITEQEANDLMYKLIDLRNAVKTGDKSIKNELKKHERICIEKFTYLVTMRTSRYRSFSNYDDLNQEGMEALLKAMDNYNPSKGSFFWWSGHYISTRIARSANLHTTIRFPLKVAKEMTPHKESLSPSLIDEESSPEDTYENMQTNYCLEQASKYLTPLQRDVLDLTYGLSGDKPKSVNKICNELNITRAVCLKAIKTGLEVMKENIKI